VAPSAERRWTAFWNDADDRRALTRAADAIDKLLSRDPERHGEPLDDMRRVLVIPPLAVTYEIRDADRTVVVLSVAYRADAG
jgi:mRNA-degrading endonuclease RelE of RelBE toxin-antitoxin system